MPDPGGTPISVECADGFTLGGHRWTPGRPDEGPLRVVIVTAATGVRATYYHRYAAFLAEAGFHVITFDYRGIGESRPDRLRGMRCRWQDWGRLDFDAVVAHVRSQWPDAEIAVVGHSVGGVVPLWADRSVEITRMLTVGGQYNWWRDWAPSARRTFLWRWKVVTPVLALVCGYVPAKRLGWMEDVPRGVAWECAWRRRRMEDNYPRRERPGVRATAAAIDASVLAVAPTDDDYGTVAALRRPLDYLPDAPRIQVMIPPAALGHDAIGHFGLFHSRHRDDFWPMSVRWLRDGENPWPDLVVWSSP